MKILKRISLNYFTNIFKWLALYITPLNITYLKADKYLKDRRYSESILLFKEIINFTQNTVLTNQIRCKLAYALFRTNHIEEAKELLQRVLIEDPANHTALIQLVVLYRWTDRDSEAAWVLYKHLIKRHIQLKDRLKESKKCDDLDNHMVPDLKASPDLLALFTICTFDSDTKALLPYAEHILSNFTMTELSTVQPQLSLGVYELYNKRYDRALDIFNHLSNAQVPSIDAALYAAEIHIKKNKFDEAHNLLNSILEIVSDHPKATSLLASLYLKAGDNFNTDFALQLAKASCRYSGWVSVNAMFVLAEAYYHCGDKLSALMVARRAKNLASKNISASENVKGVQKALDILIESLDDEDVVVG